MFQTYLVCLFLSPLFPLFHIIRIFGLTSCTSPAKQLKLGCTPKLTNQHLDNPDNNLLFLFGIRPIYCLCIGEIINFQFFFQLLQKNASAQLWKTSFYQYANLLKSSFSLSFFKSDKSVSPLISTLMGHGTLKRESDYFNITEKKN